MSRFFVDSSAIGDGLIRIEGPDARHILQVLRMKCGDPVTVCDGAGTEYFCRILTAESGALTAEILKSEASAQELPVQITLYQGLPKKDKMDLIVQKAVELGAFEIVPVMMKRTIVKLDDPKKEEKVIKERIASEDAQFSRFEDQLYLHNNLSLHECYLEMLSGSTKDVGITSNQRYTQEEFIELVAEENEMFGQNVTDIRLFYNDIQYNYSAIEKTEPDTIKNEPIGKFGDELADCLRLDKKIKQFINELIAFDIVKTSYDGSVIVNHYGTTEAISKDLFAGMLTKDDAVLSRYTKEYLMRQPYRH